MINQIKSYKEHQKRVEGYILILNSIFDKSIEQVSSVCKKRRFKGSDGIFSFSVYPEIEKEVDEVLKKLFTDLATLVSNSVTDEWDYSNRKNDELVKAVFGKKSFENTRFKRFYNRNEKAREAFVERKINGLNLSDRIWKYVEGFKEEIELCIDDALSDGRSAAQLSRDLRNHLQEPDRLFRRVRNKYGNLVLSKKAKVFNPGSGEYRSSYKNAMRVSRTEINMAYRKSDYLRWQQLDFVVGFEVKRSNNHYDCPVCNALAGRYPKDFVFVGWHPQCRCHVVAILCSNQEMDEMNDKIMRGDFSSKFVSHNEVKSVPQDFEKWIKDNKVRLKESKSKPYFIRDNEKYINI